MYCDFRRELIAQLGITEINNYLKLLDWMFVKFLYFVADGFLKFLLHRTVNVDCVKFEYVVLAKYHHMLIFEFDLLTKQHILILCKKLL